MGGSAESNSLREEDIVKYLVSVENEVLNYLEKCLKEHAIPLEVYERVISLNEEVTKKLLEGLGKIEPSEVHILEPDRVREWEFARIVIELIKASSHKREIIDLAHKIREDYSLVRDFPLDWSPKEFIYDPTGVSEEPAKIWDSEIEIETVLRVLDHYTGVAKAVEEKIRTLIKYVEEPDDIVRMAGRTLKIGFGDCDDFAVLIGSIWRALGFWVCIGVGPNHVFPAVILPSLEMVGEPEEINKEKKGGSARFRAIPTIVPADNIKLNLFGKAFGCYDLLNFNSPLRQNIYTFLAKTFGSGKIENLFSMKNNRKREETIQIKELRYFLEKLQDISKVYNYYPVPPVTDFILRQCCHLITLL